MKLLIIRNDNIGDLVCTTPLIQVLHEAYPNALIDLLGNSYNISILKYDSRISHLWSYSKAKHLHGFLKKFHAWMDKTALLLRLRLQRYDVIIIAVPVFNERTAKIAGWIAPKIIYGAMPEQPLRSKLPKNYRPVTIDHNKSHVLQILTYSHALGISASAPEAISLVLSKEEKQSALIERNNIPGNKKQPVLGLQISARRPQQRWSLEQWKEFISLMLPHARIRLFWSPGSASSLQHPGDDHLAAALLGSFPPHSLLAEPTNDLRQLMSSFYGCGLIVGSDGGAMHIAAGLDIPTLTLFGDINPSIWLPYSKKAHFMKSPSEKVTDITPQEVADKTLFNLSLLPDYLNH
ncbi:MAG: glycosyltransferase family 9 protein [Verrucomicrobiae bacterium]|nr:glycosyltransferase family 9 protein [Verrucomicrobiae bacterium]